MSSSSSAAFFASRLGLSQLRTDVRDRFGTAVWVSEFCRPDLEGKPRKEIELACLDRVRESERFVCVLDGRTGTDGDAEVSILEIELFIAALHRKPMRIFLLEPYQGDPRARDRTLVQLAQMASPEAVGPKTERQILEEIDRFLGEPTGRSRRGLASKMIEALALKRFWDKLERRDPAGSDVLFLGGAFLPLGDAHLDEVSVSRLIDEAAAASRPDHGLAGLWKAYRQLARAPYSRNSPLETLRLWNRLMGQWSRASAWYGLHGHFFLGRLAAINTALEVQKIARDVPERHGSDSIHSSLGAAASEYHSIAKRTPSFRLRRALRHRALELVERALSECVSDPSGLLLIRGSIQLSLGRAGTAVDDYASALELRLTEADPARVGEAEVELGLGRLRLGQVRKAGRLIETGVARMRDSADPGFLVRALRKLFVLQAVTLRWRDARDTLDEALSLAAAHGLEGQSRQLRSLGKYLPRRKVASGRPEGI